MIKDGARWKDLEDEFIKNTPPLPYHEALRMFESMWKEGISLGVLPPEDPLDGIEVDMEIARILNSCSKPPRTRTWLREFDASINEKKLTDIFEGILRDCK